MKWFALMGVRGRSPLQAHLLPFCRLGKWSANVDVWEHIQCLVFFLQIGSDLRVQHAYGQAALNP